MGKKINRSQLIEYGRPLRQFNYNIDFYDNLGNKFPTELEARCTSITYSPGSLMLEFLASESISVMDLTTRIKSITLNMLAQNGKTVDTFSLQVQNIRKLVNLELAGFSGDSVKYLFEFETHTII